MRLTIIKYSNVVISRFIHLAVAPDLFNLSVGVKFKNGANPEGIKFKRVEQNCWRASVVRKLMKHCVPSAKKNSTAHCCIWYLRVASVRMWLSSIILILEGLNKSFSSLVKEDMAALSTTPNRLRVSDSHFHEIFSNSPLTLARSTGQIHFCCHVDSPPGVGDSTTRTSTTFWSRFL